MSCSRKVFVLLLSGLESTLFCVDDEDRRFLQNAGIFLPDFHDMTYQKTVIFRHTHVVLFVRLGNPTVHESVKSGEIKVF